MSDLNNQELLFDFIDESIESLDKIDTRLVNLESTPDNMEIINSIFRPFHSLKGNAAYFELLKVKKAAHTLENLLDALRKKSLLPDRNIINSILKGQDLLRGMLQSIRESGPEVPNENLFQTVLTSVAQILDTNECTGIDANTVSQLLETMQKKAPELQNEIDDLKILLKPLQRRNEHHNGKEKGSVNENREPSHGSVRELLNFLRSEKGKKPGDAQESTISQYLQNLKPLYAQGEGCEIIETAEDIFQTFTNADTGIDELAVSLLLEEIEKLPPPETSTDTLQTQNSKPLPSEGKKEQHGKTVRISEEALDAFFKDVGELLGIEEAFRHLTLLSAASGVSGEFSRNMKQAVSQFEQTSKELRTKIMAIRQVRAGILLQKAPRIARDIAAQTGKNISVILRGEDVAIDKSYVEILDAPLTHMVRNAADHGIEESSARKMAGKTETGTITITMGKKENELLLSVSDDGAGLDFNALNNKALENGLIKPGEKISHDATIDLLFTSGISTAEKVTDISGRGVGMDVAKQAIEQAGGKISVQSEKGKGTTFMISLPRSASTQIIDGYMVRSFEGLDYILPLNIVVEAFAPLPGDISSVVGKGRVVTRRKTAYPLFVIDNILEGTDTYRPAEDSGMAVLLNLSGKHIALAVHEAIGIQKIVKKPVKGDFFDDTIFEGASVGGTGSVTLIISKGMLEQAAFRDSGNRANL